MLNIRYIRIFNQVIFLTGLNNCFAAPLRMRLCLIYDWKRIFSIRRVSGYGYTFRVDKHLHSEEFIGRDYFPESNSSPFKGIRRQGLFSRVKFIPIQRNPLAGIIFLSQIHPHSKEFTFRDYFLSMNSSPYKGTHRQGLFPRAESIPFRKNSPPGMLWEYRRHPPNP